MTNKLIKLIAQGLQTLLYSRKTIYSQNERETSQIDVRQLNRKKIFEKNIKQLHIDWFIENHVWKCIEDKHLIHLVSSMTIK